VPRVLNKRFDSIPKNAVFIGRPSDWGNPFPVTKLCPREISVAKYEIYLLRHPTLIKRARVELRGKDLICFCAPLACHGDVLLRVANIYICPVCQGNYIVGETYNKDKQERQTIYQLPHGRWYNMVTKLDNVSPPADDQLVTCGSCNCKFIPSDLPKHYMEEDFPYLPKP